MPSYTSSFNTSYVDNSIRDSYNVTSNYNVTGSYNTSINNSGNTTVATVAAATPQYPVYATLPPVVSYPSYPSYPYVALSQIPYTGFDFGFMGNSLYFAALVAFALAAGYLIVYYIPSFNLRKAGVSNKASEITDAPKMFAFAAPTQASARASNKNSQERTYDAQYAEVSKDAMTFARSETGAPRIVITRN